MLFLSLRFAPALYPRHLIFNSSGLGVLFPALHGLWKARSATPTCEQHLKGPELPAEIVPAGQH